MPQLDVPVPGLVVAVVVDRDRHSVAVGIERGVLGQQPLEGSGVEGLQLTRVGIEARQRQHGVPRAGPARQGKGVWQVGATHADDGQPGARSVDGEALGAGGHAVERGAEGDLDGGARGPHVQDLDRGPRLRVGEDLPQLGRVAKDLEDVQSVYENADIADDIAEKLA